MSNSQEERDEIVKKLSNFLKLPKAQRWICCEWFYSDIDRVIFESENDFALCIKQSFPRLKTNKLNRKQWCILRSLIGKPRRCSDAFFQEERQMLEEKRQKIRLIQQRKISENELIDLKDLPQEIPLTLSIGHRVYTHISSPEEGVFLGTIAAVDPVEHTYRVVFDRSSIGSQTVHDYELKSVTPVQVIPIKAYIQTYRPKIQSTQILNSNNLQTILNNNKSTPNSSLGVNNLIIDDLNALNSSNKTNNMMQTNHDQFKFDNDSLNTTGRLGGFPIHLLLMITRLNKILIVKKECIKKLNDLNLEAEKLKANNKDYNNEFKNNYASIVSDLDKLNKDLNDYANGLKSYCEEYSTTLTNGETILDIRKHYLNESIDLINKLEFGSNYTIKQNLIEDNLNKINLNENSSNSSDIENLNTKLKSKHISNLILKMTSLMLQLKDFVNSTSKNLSFKQENNFSNKTDILSNSFLPFCTKTLNESIGEIKNSLKSTSNRELFEDKVEIHINHIQSALCHYNKLNAFKYELNDQSIDED